MLLGSWGVLTTAPGCSWGPGDAPACCEVLPKGQRDKKEATAEPPTLSPPAWAHETQAMENQTPGQLWSPTRPVVHAPCCASREPEALQACEGSVCSKLLLLLLASKTLFWAAHSMPAKQGCMLCRGCIASLSPGLGETGVAASGMVVCSVSPAVWHIVDCPLQIHPIPPPELVLCAPLDREKTHHQRDMPPPPHTRLLFMGLALGQERGLTPVAGLYICGHRCSVGALGCAC